MPQAMEVEVDDDGEFLAVARYDNALVAHLLICLSCSKTCVPWPQQLPESLSPTWGRRKVRSGAPVALEGAKREKEVGGASPATPLSWSGTSGTSGSRSDDDWSTPLRSPKRRQQQQRPKRGGAHEDEERGWPPRPLSMQGSEVCHGGGEQVDAPPAKGTVPEWSRRGCLAPNGAKVRSFDEGGELHVDSVVAATPVVGSLAAGSGSSKSSLPSLSVFKPHVAPLFWEAMKNPSNLLQSGKYLIMEWAILMLMRVVVNNLNAQVHPALLHKRLPSALISIAYLMATFRT